MKPVLPALTGEFREGWRIILGASLAAGSGVVLVFLNFSMFVVELTQELQVSRGELGSVQALIITAALGSPVIGRMADLFGVRRVFIVCTLLVSAVHVLAASFASSLLHMALAVAATGFFGVGSTSVVLTRPINAHFREHRGKALGLMAMGISLISMVFPPILQQVMGYGGWRAGFVSFAVASIVIGIPAVLLLLPKGGRSGSGIGSAPTTAGDRKFLKERDFWFLVFSLITMSLATAGTISQMAPMIQDEGLSASTAALAVSFFAAGQFVGRLGGGWLLDRFEPRRVAFALTLMPAFGFIILLTTAGLVPAALLAAAIIGLQQGAELDIFAYFVGRRFDVARYGTIYGALVGLGWIGNVGGMVGMGQIYDAYGSYAPAQLLGIAALVVSAVLVLLVRLPDAPQERAA
jgi:predicted MFS family arabinose efflux permease